MMAFIVSALTWALSGALARVLIGGGITLVTATWVGGYVNDALSNADALLGGLPADFAQFLAYAGLGSFLSIIGSALLARVAISGATSVIGMGRSTT